MAKSNGFARACFRAALAVYLIAMSATAVVGASQPVEPAWPRNFVLEAGAETSYAFMAGNPGPVVVNVKWRGLPLLVSLLKPNGSAVDRQGKESVTLEYEATAADVKTGTAWRVRLRCEREAPKSVPVS